MPRVLFPLVALAACAHASPLARRTDEVAGRAIAIRAVAGLAVAVVRNGEPVLARGYGVTDLRAGTPVTPETRFRVMSVTKQFTAVALLRFVEEGRVSLDDPVAKFFPGSFAGLTVRHLLSHTSGLAEIARMPEFPGLRQPSDAVPLLAAAPPSAPPGTAFDYNNSNFVLAGLIVEQLAGKPLYRHLDETLFRPLGMRATGPCPDDLPVVGYARRAEGLVPAEPFRLPPGEGSASLCTTLLDLIAWERAAPLRPETAALSRRPVKLADGRDAGAGLGVLIDDDEGRKANGAFGAGGGFFARIVRYPADGVTVIVLANTGSQAVDGVRRHIARAALGIPDPDPRDEPLSPAERARFSGDYRFDGPGIVLHVFERDGRLFARVKDPVGEKLLYQGRGAFVGEEDRDTRLTIDPASGAAELVTPDGTRLQGHR